MGIALKELLASEFFRDFRVVSGRKGLYKEVQGVAIVDAPDGFHWSKGKEFVMTSGYVFATNPGNIVQCFQEGGIRLSTAIAIKRGRYLNEIPTELITLCEQYDIPLLDMPFEVAFMDVMNQINIVVLNRTIRRFRIQANPMVQMSSLTYKEQKIKKILQAVEQEMNFPAFIYDLTEKNGYYSSPNFKQITESFGLTQEDYWEPSVNYTKSTLCDYTGMTRYRLVDGDNPQGPRISWVLTPITMGQETKAYFVVMESRDFLDYYDEYAIRIAFLMLQEVYEEISITQSMGNIGFENLILYALNCQKEDAGRIADQAGEQGISVDTEFITIGFRQENPKISLRKERKTVLECFQNSPLASLGKFAFTGENEGVILWELTNPDNSREADIRKLLQRFQKKLLAWEPELLMKYGMNRQKCSLLQVREALSKCQKALETGRMIAPDDYIWDYDSLGPFVWLQIPQDELTEQLSRYQELLKNEKNRELLYTLKVYLENNMNYSTTADLLYVHINTVRKRIDKINELLDLDWDDYGSRLKMQMLLQLMGITRE